MQIFTRALRQKWQRQFNYAYMYGYRIAFDVYNYTSTHTGAIVRASVCIVIAFQMYTHLHAFIFDLSRAAEFLSSLSLSLCICLFGHSHVRMYECIYQQIEHWAQHVYCHIGFCIGVYHTVPSHIHTNTYVFVRVRCIALYSYQCWRALSTCHRSLWMAHNFDVWHLYTVLWKYIPVSGSHIPFHSFAWNILMWFQISIWKKIKNYSMHRDIIISISRDVNFKMPDHKMFLLHRIAYHLCNGIRKEPTQLFGKIFQPDFE